MLENFDLQSLIKQKVNLAKSGKTLYMTNKSKLYKKINMFICHISFVCLERMTFPKEVKILYMQVFLILKLLPFF
jgi:hypothetical protein